MAEAVSGMSGYARGLFIHGLKQAATQDMLDLQRRIDVDAGSLVEIAIGVWSFRVLARWQSTAPSLPARLVFCCLPTWPERQQRFPPKSEAFPEPPAPPRGNYTAYGRSMCLTRFDSDADAALAADTDSCVLLVRSYRCCRAVTFISQESHVP